MTDFQVVKSRKNKKKKAIGINKNETQPFGHNDAMSIEKIESKINEAMELSPLLHIMLDVLDKEYRLTLRISEYYSSMRDMMSDSTVEEVVCYGIGNFADCYIARYQLALLMLLREDIFKIDKHDCHFYDPKLYKVEEQFLTNSGFSIIAENEEGKRRTKGNTLFYMPHCGKSLYNNLLWANWNFMSLSHCVVIGNSFTNIVDMNPRRKLEESCWYLLNIAPHVKEKQFPENFQYTDIFNDTVIISFPEDKLQEVTSQIWQHIDEPVYNEDDQEFISNKSSF